jgi:hypothetical protein
MGLASNISRVGQFAKQGDELLGKIGARGTPVGQMVSGALKTTAKLAPKLSFLVSKKDDIIKEGKAVVKAIKEKDVVGGLSSATQLAKIGKEAYETKEYKGKKGKEIKEAQPMRGGAAMQKAPPAASFGDA